MPVQDLCTRKAAAQVLRAVHIQEEIWRVFLVLSVPSPGPVTLQGSGKPYLVMTNSLGDLELASAIYNQAVLADPHPPHCHCCNPCVEPTAIWVRWLLTEHMVMATFATDSDANRGMGRGGGAPLKEQSYVETQK